MGEDLEHSVRALNDLQRRRELTQLLLRGDYREMERAMGELLNLVDTLPQPGRPPRRLRLFDRR